MLSPATLFCGACDGYIDGSLLCCPCFWRYPACAAVRLDLLLDDRSVAMSDTVA